MQQPVNNNMNQQRNQGNQSNAPRKPPVITSSNPSIRRFNNNNQGTGNSVNIPTNPISNEQSLQMPQNVVTQHTRPNIPPQPQNPNQNNMVTSMQVTTSNMNTQNQNNQNVNVNTNQVQLSNTATKAPIVLNTITDIFNDILFLT